MSMASDLAKIPQFKRGIVWCTKCGNTQKVDGVIATLSGGWPKCCGQTMTIDSPEERERLRAQQDSSDVLSLLKKTYFNTGEDRS